MGEAVGEIIVRRSNREIALLREDYEKRLADIKSKQLVVEEAFSKSIIHLNWVINLGLALALLLVVLASLKVVVIDRLSKLA